MTQMSLQKKIGLTTLLLIALLLLLGFGAEFNVHRMRVAVADISEDSLPGVATAARIEAALRDARGQMLFHASSTSPAEMDQAEAAIQTAVQSYRESCAEYEKTILTQDDRELYNKVQPAFEAAMAAWEKTRQLARGGKPQEAMAQFRSETWPAFNGVNQAVRGISELNLHSGTQSGANVRSVASTAEISTWILLVVGVFVGGGFSFFLLRQTHKVLAHSITELTETVEQVAKNAGQVSAGAQALASGASQQAASVEETSATTEEISSMTSKNADNARRAAEVVDGTRKDFELANRQLEALLASMQQITGSSEKISKIIKVIDEIAFQTNILALNAAVEAARAGEAGMGFAVVAEEVRSLAQRSADAAKDTTALIEESINNSHKGKENVERMAAAIHAITTGSEQIKLLIDEVNAGSQEQARGVEQIAQAMVQIEQVTQKTATNSEDAAAVGEKIKAQAEALRTVIGELAEIVGGSAETAPAVPERRPAVLTPLKKKVAPLPPPPPPASAPAAPALAKLAKAVAPARIDLDAEPAAAPPPKNLIPMDDDFKEF